MRRGQPASPAVTFSASSDDTMPDPAQSPFSSRNVPKYINADGSVDLVWENDPDNLDLIPLWQKLPDGQWVIIEAVPAGTNPRHYPPS